MSITNKWAALLEKQPNLRIRNAAKELGVSELELLHTKVNDGVIKLDLNLKELLPQIESLGEVMALTRNDEAVHERHGIYANTSFGGPVGLVVNSDIDLRIFGMHWKYAYAVEENDRKSFQFFDQSGEATHKIYLLEQSNKEVWNHLIATYKSDNQQELQPPKAYPEKKELNQPENIEAFQNDWKALKDTHDFFGLLEKHNLNRHKSMYYAPEGMVRKIDNEHVRSMLIQAAENQVPIMAFVGNKGTIQIHSGVIRRVVDARGWLNVLDPEFNLHLNDKAFFETFVVRKPAEGDVIHSLEVYNEQGDLIVQFFGARKPGEPELQEWRYLLDNLN